MRERFTPPPLGVPLLHPEVTGADPLGGVGDAAYASSQSSSMVTTSNGEQPSTLYFS
jgi:hypothetical protein